MRDTGQRLVAAVQDCTSLAVWARTDEELIEALLVWHDTVQRLDGVTILAMIAAQVFYLDRVRIRTGPGAGHVDAGRTRKTG